MYKYALKNITKKHKENFGRSMVEMLGVLAIVGVLTIGSGYLYLKAYEKYEINKFKEQMYFVYTTMVIAFSQEGEFTALGRTVDTGNKIAIAKGAIPKDMIVDKEEGILQHSYGGDFGIVQGWYDDYYFTMIIKDIPPAACEAFFASIPVKNFRRLHVTNSTAYDSNKNDFPLSMETIRKECSLLPKQYINIGIKPS